MFTSSPSSTPSPPSASVKFEVHQLTGPDRKMGMREFDDAQAAYQYADFMERQTGFVYSVRPSDQVVGPSRRVTR